MNPDTENQGVLKRISRAIELATKHHDFALYFIQCELLVDQDNYINYLQEQCNRIGVELLKVDLSRKIIRNLREVILNELDEKFQNSKPDKLTIAVTGLEASILTDVNEESPAVLQILNMGREHYAKDLSYPSTFWLPGYAITKIASVAPDFWSWRSGGVDELVSGEKAKKQAINEAIRSDEPTNWYEGIYQVILFERLIEGHPGSENGTDEQKSEYRKLQYRLGVAYDFLEKYPRAYQHYRRGLEIGKLSSDLVQQNRELNALGKVCHAMGKLQKSLKYSHLFSIDVSTDAGLEDDLNKIVISGKLKNIFKISGFSLLNNATVAKKKEDEWVITDEEKFIVRKEDGKLNICKNFLEDSLKYFEKHFDLSVSEEYMKGQGTALGNIGLVYREMHQNEKAIEYLKRALTINKEIRYPHGESDNLGNLGLAYQEIGDFEKAIEYHLDALEVSKKIEDRKREIKDLSNLGVAYDSQGKTKGAIDYFQQALELSRNSEDRPSERDSLIKIAHCFWKLGGLEEAQNYYKDAKDTCQKLRDDRNLCDVLTYLAELSHEFEETKKEIDLYKEALELSRKLRDEEKELLYLRKLIQLHHREWDPDKAKNYIDDACKLLGNNLKRKKINVWLKDSMDKQPERLAMNQEYYLCLNIGEPDREYSPLRQTDFIFNLASEREDSNKQPSVSAKLTEVGAQEQIPQPTPKIYGVGEKPIVEEKTVIVTETSVPKAISVIETQPTSLTTDQQPRQEPSRRIHEEPSKEVEVSVSLQSSSAFEFDKSEGRLYVSWEGDSETIYFRIAPMKIGKQSITIVGAANDIPFDDCTIKDIEVEETAAEERRAPESRVEKPKDKGSQPPESPPEKVWTRDEIVDAIENREDLKGADMKGFLKWVTFSGIDTTGANLRDIDLSGANLSGANLSGADLSGAKLAGANLRDANLSKAKVRQVADWSGANLSGVNLSGADLAGANLRDINLSRAKLRQADLSGANLSGADLSDANLVQAKLRHAQMDNCTLKNADLRFCNIWYAQMQTVDLSGADLYAAEFYSANMRGAIFENAKLEKTSLNSANLLGAKFKGAEFSNSNLDNAMLDGANFVGADIDSSTRIYSLKKARWRNANFDPWVEEELMGSS